MSNRAQPTANNGPSGDGRDRAEAFSDAQLERDRRIEGVRRASPHPGARTALRALCGWLRSDSSAETAVKLCGCTFSASAGEHSHTTARGEDRHAECAPGTLLLISTLPRLVRWILFFLGYLQIIYCWRAFGREFRIGIELQASIWDAVGNLWPLSSLQKGYSP